MKQIIRSLALVLALLTGSMALHAQEVNTLYFLENAPQRSMFNPALMPVSTGYLYFTPLGYTSIGLFTDNRLALSDLVYNKGGKTITPLNTGERDAFLKKYWSNNLFNIDLTTTILAFGAATKKGGYFHAGIFLRADGGLNVPKKMMESILAPEGGIGIRIPGVNVSGLDMSVESYLEFMGGYTRPLNDQWTIGGKLKFLLGVGNARVQINDLSINPIEGSKDLDISMKADMSVSLPAIVNVRAVLPRQGESLLDAINDFGNRSKNLIDKTSTDYLRLYSPVGYGAAIDFGFTYKPIKYLQIAAAVNDLGFIYWRNATQGSLYGNARFDGMGTLQLKADNQGKIDTDAMSKQVEDHMKSYLDNVYSNFDTVSGHYVRMAPHARLNVSIDGLFWENRVGLGILSQTKLVNNKVYEELTIGGFFRPVNWFNIAASYSILNGHGGNIGAALGFAPYDGVMMTLAADYIPCYYADMASLTKSSKSQYYLPYKTPGLNLAFGFSIVWGTNKKRDADKDGVLDNLDMCPKSPRNVRVDAFGCPVDTDGDGVPDYLDECQDTPKEAYGMVDAAGCEIDTDLDGVPDYRDLCPDTPEEARNSVDENGCTRDTDHDGVPDYRDDCPNTLPEAAAHVDEHGCDKDSDGDGIPDYIDKCPDTPEEAYNYLDENGCPLDKDEDGVPDYKDKCPRTVYAARQHVDTCGCDKDSDLDGIPDYLDECPYVAGVKENKGCPQLKRAVTTLLKKAMTGIQFETGKAVIIKKSYPILDEVAKVFIDNPTYIVEVQGHTDNVGNAEVNMSLSEKRAQAVRDYLIKAGVPADRMTAHGYGSTMPIDDNSTKAGRAKNRRVEFKITFEEVHYEIINDHNPGEDSPAANEATSAEAAN